jgi:hypothetical protein
MKPTETLSYNRITKYGNGNKGYYLEEDVKQSINECLKEVLFYRDDEYISINEIFERYFGRELIE